MKLKPMPTIPEEKPGIEDDAGATGPPARRKGIFTLSARVFFVVLMGLALYAGHWTAPSRPQLVAIGGTGGGGASGAFPSSLLGGMAEMVRPGDSSSSNSSSSSSSRDPRSSHGIGGDATAPTLENKNNNKQNTDDKETNTMLKNDDDEAESQENKEEEREEEGKKKRVAVCFTGQARSFDLTADSLRANLLDQFEADGFVYATVQEGDAAKPSTKGALETLNRTGRVVRATVGPQEELYDQDLSKKIKTSPAIKTYIHTKDALERGNTKVVEQWLDKLAGQHLGRLGCRNELLRYERERGIQYDVFARVRVDTQLFQPLNRTLLDAIDRPEVAIIPKNGDWGTIENPGLCDKMLIGGRQAYGADATVFKLVSDAHWKLKEVWSAEGVHRAQMEEFEIKVLREPIAYCSLTLEGQCKLGHELLDSVSMIPGLLEQCPGLCSDRYYEPGPCSESRHVFVPPQVKKSEPGLCRLNDACEKAWTKIGNKSQGVKACAHYFHERHLVISN